MNPLLLLALVLLVAGMLLRLVGWIIVSIVRGLWSGSRLLGRLAAKPFARRERPLPLPEMVAGAR